MAEVTGHSAKVPKFYFGGTVTGRAFVVLDSIAPMTKHGLAKREIDSGNRKLRLYCWPLIGLPKCLAIQKDSPCWDSGILSRSPPLALDDSSINKTSKGILRQPGENGSGNLLKPISWFLLPSVLAGLQPASSFRHVIARHWITRFAFVSTPRDRLQHSTWSEPSKVESTEDAALKQFELEFRERTDDPAFHTFSLN
ncbi:hypothetical protein C8J56DRAFT_899701 [Mycena floridula]|nr:hypothetical protein C8J56DRAFT_899701 [Mycena floridula]